MIWIGLGFSLYMIWTSLAAWWFLEHMGYKYRKAAWWEPIFLLPTLPVCYLIGFLNRKRK